MLISSKQSPETKTKQATIHEYNDFRSPGGEISHQKYHIIVIIFYAIQAIIIIIIITRIIYIIILF